MDVATADVEMLGGRARVVEAAEEQRGARNVLERLRPPVQIGLQVFLGNRVTAERPERKRVLAHEAEEFARRAQMGPFGCQDRIARIRNRAGRDLQ